MGPLLSYLLATAAITVTFVLLRWAENRWRYRKIPGESVEVLWGNAVQDGARDCASARALAQV